MGRRACYPFWQLPPSHPSVGQRWGPRATAVLLNWCSCTCILQKAGPVRDWSQSPMPTCHRVKHKHHAVLASMPDLSFRAICLLVRASPSAPQHVRMTRRFCSEAPQAHPNPQSPCNRGLSGTFLHCGLRGPLEGKSRTHDTESLRARSRGSRSEFCAYQGYCFAEPGRSCVHVLSFWAVRWRGVSVGFFAE